MADNHQANKVKVLNDRDHTLKRIGMYLGSSDFSSDMKFILNDKNKIEMSTGEYVPAIVTMVREVLNNSIDEFIRTNGDFSKNISISFSKNRKTITIEDDGRGISSDIERTKNLPEAVVAVTSMKAGGNFEHDNESKTGGTNGIGVSAVNIMSKYLKLDTYDGKLLTTVECFDNTDPKKTKWLQIKIKKRKPYTNVTFTPNFDMFESDCLSDFEISILKKYLLDQSIIYPGIKFTVNDKEIKCDNFESYTKYYSNSCVISENKHCTIGLYSGDEQHMVSFVGTIETPDGGTHVDYIKLQLSNELRKKYEKKYKMMPIDIWSNVHMVVILKDIVGAKYGSQDKRKFTTAISKIKYVFEDVNFKKIALLISQNKSIMTNILEIFKAKQKIKEKKILENQEKDIDKVTFIPKAVMASKKNKSLNRLYLFEGDSAIGKFARNKGVYFSGFPLRGKFISCFNRSPFEMMQNAEVFTLCKILGLKLSDSDISKSTHAEIAICTDSDEDGNAITALLISFIYKYWPDFIKNGKLFRAVSPLIILEDDTRFYSLTKYREYQNKDIKHSKMKFYAKGLGSLDNNLYEEMLYTMMPITLGDAEKAYESLKLAFDKKGANKRKDWLS